MGSAWTEAASRQPIRAERLGALLAEGGFGGPAPRLLASVGSTNAEAAGLVAHLSCVAAEEQVAGRGRLDRTWASPAGAGLWCSTVLVLGDAPADRRTWLPMAAGLAACDAIAGVPARLKWPNDLVVTEGTGSPGKLGGILVELAPGGRAIVGIGINVGISTRGLPFAGATSLLSEGGDLDREALLARLLLALERRFAQWRDDLPALRADYRARCATLGRPVRVSLPGGRVLEGMAAGVDDHGALVVRAGDSEEIVTAGDVVHATI